MAQGSVTEAKQLCGLFNLLAIWKDLFIWLSINILIEKVNRKYTNTEARITEIRILAVQIRVLRFAGLSSRSFRVYKSLCGEMIRWVYFSALKNEMNEK